MMGNGKFIKLMPSLDLGLWHEEEIIKTLFG